MAEKKQERSWHPDFKRYMEFIAAHENYHGLKYTRKENGEIAWIAPKKSKTGMLRVQWAKRKAAELGIPVGPGAYAKVMLAIHPTKKKPCQICGKVMSLFYVYPNQALLKSLKKVFGLEFTLTQSVFEVVEILVRKGFAGPKIKDYFIKSFHLEERYGPKETRDFLKCCEALCRMGKSNLLGPGAMSNFPDRYDGFHTYNRCCRVEQDKGRTTDNLRTYGKDRRAYELWSDGNLHAANTFMKSAYFAGESADHIGPISLGFKHDPLLLQKMSAGDNSAKRDQLLYEDIEKIRGIEEENKGFIAVSWFSQRLWHFIRTNYAENKDKIERYRYALKQNMANFMEILWRIKTGCDEEGQEFLIAKLLRAKFECFQNDYRMDEQGRIVERTPRNFTDATRKETVRFKRIALASVDDYHNKENRNMQVSLDSRNYQALNGICGLIGQKRYNEALLRMKGLLDDIQQKLIQDLR